MKCLRPIALVFCALLVACTTPSEPSLDISLYDGKPIDTLSTAEPPTTEKEAISRGDASLQAAIVTWHCMNTFGLYRLKMVNIKIVHSSILVASTSLEAT